MNYIIGKVVEELNGSFLFESNNIGYEFKGIVPKDTTKVLLVAITNKHSGEMTTYAFENNEKKEIFNELNQIKGVGPLSASSVISKCSIEEIKKARESGNFLILEKSGVKTFILSKIISKENINIDINIVVLSDTLKKYGFKIENINTSIQMVFDSSLSLEKNLVKIIKNINKNK